jgi:hypothetical protein
MFSVMVGNWGSGPVWGSPSEAFYIACLRFDGFSTFASHFSGYKNLKLYNKLTAVDIHSYLDYTALLIIISYTSPLIY